MKERFTHMITLRDMISAFRVAIENNIAYALTLYSEILKYDYKDMLLNDDVTLKEFTSLEKIFINKINLAIDN